MKTAFQFATFVLRGVPGLGRYPSKAEDPSVVAPVVAPTGDGADHGTTAPVVLENTPAALVANKGVGPIRRWLQDRYFFVLNAGNAYFMRAIVRGIIGLQYVNTPPHVGLRQRVARKLCLKLILALKLLLEFQNTLLHVHLRNLGIEELSSQFNDELERLEGVRFRGADNLLEFLSRPAGFPDRPCGVSDQSKK